MSNENPAITLRSTIYLLFKFMVIVPFITVGWWLLLPYYSHVLLQLAGSVLLFVLRVPVESGSILIEGILNTNSKLAFNINGKPLFMDLALITTNLAPYVALIFATGQIPFQKRLRILGAGSAIIVVTHVLCCTLFFYLIYSHIDDAAYLEGGSPPFYITLTQFMLTLPFLLWIVFAYWPQLTRIGSGTES